MFVVDAASAVGSPTGARLRQFGRSLARNPSALAVIVPGLVAALFGALVLSFRFGLTGIHSSIVNNRGYDDGVYFGSAVRLLHDNLPYADFLFLHPPGITLLMSPMAGVAALFGTPAGLALARIATVAVSAANASLAASMLRHRGPAAMLTAGLLVALYPAGINATHTLLLEPYVLCFCLIGANLLFDGGDVASRRRILIAGLAFGFGCSIKLWGAPVVLAAGVVLAVHSRKSLAAFFGGVVGAFVAVCLPFFLAAPGAFVSNVFSAQIQRRVGGSATVLYKLRTLTGADSIESVHMPDYLVVGASVIFVAFAGYRIIRGRRDLRPRDWCIIGGTLAATGAVFAVGQFYPHYGYLPFAWIAMAAGMLVPRTLVARVPRAALIAVVAVACTGMLVEDTRHARVYLEGSFDVADIVREVVPSGACLVVTFATFPVVSDRFTAADPDCPKMIDPFGEWVAHTPVHRPYKGDFPEPFVADFVDKLDRADYVAFGKPFSAYVPWTPEVLRWYTANFAEVRHTDNIFLYHHRSRATPPKQFPSLMAGSPDQLIVAGMNAEKSGHIDGAFDYYQAAIARGPNNKFAHFDAGHVWQMWGNAQQAESEYRTALRLDPDFVNALNNLAVLKTGSDPVTAIELYRRLLALRPDSPGVSFNLGILLYRSGDASGKELIRQAIAAQPGLAESVPADIALD